LLDSFPAITAVRSYALGKCGALPGSEGGALRAISGPLGTAKAGRLRCLEGRLRGLETRLDAP
jgi:hypothetical protein